MNDVRNLIDPNGRPVTRADLAADLRGLGLRPGDVVLVHSSLRSIGWVAGGTFAVLQALQDVLTDAGTLVVPTHTSGLTDPAGWAAPAVPEHWWPVIRGEMPAFDRRRTPSEHMGLIAETLRTWPGVHRSNHPHVSFAAWGAQAERVTAGHQLAWSLGENSPLARVYELGGRTLLLGTTNCTSLHLAEARAGTSPVTRQGAPVNRDGRREWVTFEDWDYDDEAFEAILADFCRAYDVQPGSVGSARTLLIDQVSLVDFAEEALRRLAS